MKIGTCDCCEAQNVEISRSELAGLETWSCTEGCPAGDRIAMPQKEARACAAQNVKLRAILTSIVDDYRHDGGAVAEIFIKRAEAALAKKQEKP